MGGNLTVTDDIIVLGDVHNDFRSLNVFVNRKRPKIILQTGDMGYWPRLVERRRGPWVCKRQPAPKMGGTKLYFADGNHEDHDALDALESREVYPSVFHMPRGSTMRLDDGRVVLFMGGAFSIDRLDRVMGEGVNSVGWFPQEVLTWKSLENIPDGIHVDIVISHTCPNEFWMDSEYSSRVMDMSREVLSEVLFRFRPSLWYFGHWHRYKTGYDKGCRWTALNMTGEPMSFVKLPS